MSTNLTIEAPNFDRITKEAGQFTSDAINLLWSALNDTRASERRDFRQATEKLEPKTLTVIAAASVDNLDTQGSSIVYFTGTTAQNFTGARAPETGHSRLLFVQNSGTGTITVKNSLTSEAANQFVLSTGADYSMTTGKGIIFHYNGSKWRELARSG